jgi:hypothetical protein
MASRSFALVFGLGSLFGKPRLLFGKPRLRKAQTDSVDGFLLRFARLATLFLLALLIAYLAR